MQYVPQSYQDLLRDDTKAYAYVATVMPDGSPQVTPVWFNTDGRFILINSARGRVKDRNMRARSLVAILITDPRDPFYRYLQIRGRVVQISEEGALEHINALSMKYRGQPWEPTPGQTRVTYRIEPISVFGE
jgi:PPOX class probable F420-dependent enzyme